MCFGVLEKSGAFFVGSDFRCGVGLTRGGAPGNSMQNFKKHSSSEEPQVFDQSLDPVACGLAKILLVGEPHPGSLLWSVWVKNRG